MDRLVRVRITRVALYDVEPDDGVLPGSSPGSGATVDEDVLGEPVGVWGG